MKCVRMLTALILLGSGSAVSSASTVRSGLGGLFSGAAGPDSDASERFLQETSDSHASRDSLLQVIKNRNAWPDRREAAVAALPKNLDTETSRVLASLLLPETPLSIRTLIASRLATASCDEPCTQSILLYLERDWRSEPSVEDGGKDEEVDKQIERMKMDLRQQLYHDLLNNRQALDDVLVSYYGLGSPVPSMFGLHMIDELRLSELCLQIEMSFRLPLNSTIKNETGSLMKKFGCKQTLPPLLAPN